MRKTLTNFSAFFEETKKLLERFSFIKYSFSKIKVFMGFLKGKDPNDSEMKEYLSSRINVYVRMQDGCGHGVLSYFFLFFHNLNSCGSHTEKF